jgi:hypothetical protein
MSSGGKTSEKTTKQEVDRNLVTDYNKLTGLGAMLGGMRHEPNSQPTIAALTPAQEASMAATNNAASAFGMPTAAAPAMPEAEMSASGIKGYSTIKDFLASVAGVSDERKGQEADFYAKLKELMTPTQPASRRRTFSPVAAAGGAQGGRLFGSGD